MDYRSSCESIGHVSQAHPRPLLLFVLSNLRVLVYVWLTLSCTAFFSSSVFNSTESIIKNCRTKSEHPTL
jgi:hypothetical protein